MDNLYFCDPEMCSYCQNHGFRDKLDAKGNCHRCIVRTIAYAASVAAIRAIFKAAREAAPVTV